MVVLIIPSQLLLGTVELLELEYRNSIESCLHQDHLKATLASKLSKVDNLQRLQYDACHLGYIGDASLSQYQTPSHNQRN